MDLNGLGLQPEKNRWIYLECQCSQRRTGGFEWALIAVRGEQVDLNGLGLQPEKNSWICLEFQCSQRRTGRFEWALIEAREIDR